MRPNMLTGIVLFILCNGMVMLVVSAKKGWSSGFNAKIMPVCFLQAAASGLMLLLICS